MTLVGHVARTREVKNAYILKENLKGRDHSEDVGARGKIGNREGSCETDNELSDSIRGGEFLK
jgi:hypothetical protein